MSSYSRRPSGPSRFAILCMVATLAFACFAGSEALASTGWVRPVGGPTLLAYGEAYKASGATESRAHSGVDLGCADGCRALACQGGVVSFSGSVPGDAGGRVVAVTVAGDDGLRITYMPLSTAAVAAGQRIEQGCAVGVVAGSGDASSAAPHLHLSVRRGETYLDPAGMLSTAAGVPDPGGSGNVASPQPEAVRPPSAAQVSAPHPAPVAGAQASVAHAPVSASQHVAPAGAPSAASAGVGAQAALASLSAAHVVSPAAAVHAVTGRMSVISRMPVSTGLPVPAPHPTGLTALTASWSSASRALTLAFVGLAVGLGALACAGRSLRAAARNAASIHPAGALTSATTTPQRRA